jgi:BirA family biotin operon repressor/biotin-[acetyl-CoA-carboxylase] ligase
LTPPERIAGFRVETHGDVGSTQDLARARARAGAGDVVVVARRQTAGRGRLDRAWTSPEGNLYASAVLPVDLPPRLLPCSSLVVAVALAEAIEDLGAVPRLKWPNDLLLDGRKIAGILLELEAGHLLIGTGINIATAPPLGTATSLAAAGLATTPEALLRAYLPRLRARFSTLHEAGFAPIREAWLARAAGLGADLRVVRSGDVLLGRHGGIDETGALRVETPSGVVSVAVGDVELVRTQEKG